MNRVLLRILRRYPWFGDRIIRMIAKRTRGGLSESKLIREWVKENNVYVDMYSYGYCFDRNFNIGGKVKIGRYCSIAGNVKYFGANHPMEKISMSPYFYNQKFGLNVADVERNTLEIGHDVWIGYGTLITAGCKYIGNGAVIGAGSIVTKSIEPYTVVVGNPARVIKRRFSEDEVKKIEESCWWDYSPQDLFKYSKYMNNVLEFAEVLLKK